VTTEQFTSLMVFANAFGVCVMFALGYAAGRKL